MTLSTFLEKQIECIPFTRCGWIKADHAPKASCYLIEDQEKFNEICTSVIMGSGKLGALAVDWSLHSIVVIYENTLSPNYLKGIVNILWKPRSKKVVIKIVSMLASNTAKGIFLIAGIPKSILKNNNVKIYAEEDWEERLRIDPTAVQLKKASDMYDLLDGPLQEVIWNWIETYIRPMFIKEENMVEFDNSRRKALDTLKTCEWYKPLSTEVKKKVKKFLQRRIKVIRVQNEWMCFYACLKKTRNYLENVQLQYMGPELTADGPQGEYMWRRMYSAAITLTSQLTLHHWFKEPAITGKLSAGGLEIHANSHRK